ncbi:hypothetical protein HRbin40_01591 [bacterium HR40]|nr:hypothetical protein HRbin40_01591 [bacterium HR40]
MSPRAFLVLLCASVASLGLATWAVATRDVPVATLAVDRPLLPDLAHKLDRVAEITVRTAERSMTARRTADGWVLAEAADYPVDPEQVRGIVLGLAEMRLLEARTDRPERLSRLELEPVDGQGAKSRLVTLRDGEGKVLAEVVLGKRRFGLYGPGKAGMYVRLADSHQAWLADRAIEVPDEPLDWLDRKILELPEDEVAEVVLQPGTADVATLQRAQEPSKEFTLLELPEGRRLDADKAKRVASAFATLSMTDIAQSASKSLPDPVGRAVFRTRDGTEIAVAVSKLGEGDEAEWWLALEARASAAQASATPSSDPGSAAATKPGLDPQALQKRFAGRVFKVSRYVAERFSWKREDLLEPATAKEGS